MNSEPQAFQSNAVVAAGAAAAPAGASAAPIGVFDSGLGGLSVWREIVRHFPHENTLYFGDQGHVPYGPRSLEEIRAFSRAITEFLLAHGAKIIVVACNTASGAALHHLRDVYPQTPFVGMEPAVKPAAERSRRGAIGVLATPTTFQGALFQRLADRFGQQVTIHTQICPGLVEAIETGARSAIETRLLLEQCLAPLAEYGIDQLVLGCTHYPFLRETIEEILGPAVTVIDPAPAVAVQVGRVLRSHGVVNECDRHGRHLLYTSGSPVGMREMARTLLGYAEPVAAAHWYGFRLEASRVHGTEEGTVPEKAVLPDDAARPEEDALTDEVYLTEEREPLYSSSNNALRCTGVDPQSQDTGRDG